MTSFALRPPGRFRAAHALAAIVVAASIATPLSAQQTSPPAQAAAAPAPVAAQPARALSLADALKLAETGSEAIQIARAGVDRARGQQMQAHSQYLPQLSATAQYQRTLKSQFEVFQQAAPTLPVGTPTVPSVPPGTTYYAPCTRYLAAAGATQAEQLAALNQYALCTSNSSGGLDLTKAGFGARNQYNLGLSGSINLFTGGRVQAQNVVAGAGRRSAEIELTSQKAQLQLDVASAYYDAILSDRLVNIADTTLSQTERAFKQTSLAKQVGNTSEFEQLRAQVQRDNQLPVVIQARTNRSLAYLRLKQLLNLPYEQDVQLVDDLGDGTPAARTVANVAGAQVTPEDTSAEQRSTVRELAEALKVQEAQAKITHAQRLPAIQLTSAYGKIAFPQGAAPDLNNFLTNWTVSVGASVPLFTGGRIKGEELVAKANVAEARARLQQTRELAALDAQQALAQVQQAEAAFAASRGTTSQAVRAYSIADVRFREGISTQLELAETRTQLEQAQANSAIAARDLKVAQLRLALLRDLPLGGSTGTQSQQQRSGTGATGTGTTTGGGAGAAGQQQPQQPRSASASVSPGSGQ